MGAEAQIVSRSFLDQWLAEQRTAVLRAPNTVPHGREHNVLLNPEHLEFTCITAAY